MSEPRPTTQKLNRTHVLAQRKSPLASTHIMAPVPAQTNRSHVPAPSQMPPAIRQAPSMMPAPLRSYGPPAASMPPPIKPCVPTDDERLVMISDPTGDQAAAYRAMRDTLVAKNLPRLLAVSSAERGEGKTTCAMNLALALAEVGHERVLLIDVSLEEPAIADVLGVDDNGPTWFAPFTVSALTPSLHVATLVRRPGQPYVDIATLARVLGAFQRAGYQRVVMDTDCVAVAKPVLSLAGGVLLTTRAGTSKQTALRKAVDQIGAERCVGVMLLDADKRDVRARRGARPVEAPDAP